VSDPVLVAVGGCRASIRADDLVFTRADGVFETLLVRAGRPCLLDAHLARLHASAVLAGLPGPSEANWRAAVADALAQWDAAEESALRLVLGCDSVAFVMVSPVPVRVPTARVSGLSAVTLPRPHFPLAAAKSLSYAANSAAVRHAQRLGCDDAIFVDADGAVLEGTRSAVVIAVTDGDSKPVLLTPDSVQILPSTTLEALFATASSRGVDCRYRRLDVTDIRAAQGVWLLSSMTLAARVHTLDGVALAPAPLDLWLSALVEDAVCGRS
jgi:4-amino-4-deoxychorismate lyase